MQIMRQQKPVGAKGQIRQTFKQPNSLNIANQKSKRDARDMLKAYGSKYTFLDILTNVPIESVALMLMHDVFSTDK